MLNFLPLHSIDSSRRCTCGNEHCRSPGKHPQLRNGLKGATTSPKTIKRWFDKDPDANIGLVTGSLSGIYVIDIDPRHGGEASLDKIQAEYGKLPDDVLAITGGGGLHYVFGYPSPGRGNRKPIYGRGLTLEAMGATL